MLDARRDRALQDLARSIAHNVGVLGNTCIAHRRGHVFISLGPPPPLLDGRPLAPTQMTADPRAQELLTQQVADWIHHHLRPPRFHRHDERSRAEFLSLVK